MIPSHLTDYLNSLRSKHAALLGLSAKSTSPAERARLAHKAEGVLLAIKDLDRVIGLIEDDVLEIKRDACSDGRAEGYLDGRADGYYDGLEATREN